MEYTSLIGPAVVAAGVSGIIAIVGMIVSARTTRAIHKERLGFDEKLAERKFDFDKDLAERKATADIALAREKFQLDARMADRKRRQDLAEEVLEAFYKVRDVVRAVRVPMSYQDEAAGRKPMEMESPEVARLRNSYYAPLARLDSNRADIAALLAKRYRVAAWFGAAAEGPFQDMHEALTDIAVSAQMLIGWAGEVNHPNDRTLWRKTEGAIWARALNPDPIATKIDNAISKIEAICRPALEGSSA